MTKLKNFSVAYRLLTTGRKIWRCDFCSDGPEDIGIFSPLTFLTRHVIDPGKAANVFFTPRLTLDFAHMAWLGFFVL